MGSRSEAGAAGAGAGATGADDVAATDGANADGVGCATEEVTACSAEAGTAAGVALDTSDDSLSAISTVAVPPWRSTAPRYRYPNRSTRLHSINLGRNPSLLKAALFYVSAMISYLLVGRDGE